MKVLITGLCGFIGHHVADYLLDHTDWEIVGLDRIDATSTLHRLKALPGWAEKSKRVTFVWHDLRAAINDTVAKQIGPVHAILHLAASTHVDRSIEDPMSFVLDNVVGTTNLLEFYRTRLAALPVPFFYFSTDEVFGPAHGSQRFQEWDRYKSGNPYAASKAGAEEMCIAFANTYRLPIYVTHTMNVIDVRQHPEKFVPKVIGHVLTNRTVYIHANRDKTQAGSRFYISAYNVGAALKFLIDKTREDDPRRSIWMERGEKFNIVGEREIDNLTLAQSIAQRVGNELQYELVDFHSARPGHDLRYALDGTKLKDVMGFGYPDTLDQSLDKIVSWYLANRDWLLLD